MRVLQELFQKTYESSNINTKHIYQKRLILYGAGYCGALVAEMLKPFGIVPQFFFDMDEKKQGTRIADIEVIRPQKSENPDTYMIIVCMLKKEKLYQEIRENLSALGYREVCHIYDMYPEKKLFAKQNLVVVPDKTLLRQHQAEFEQLYEALCDEESRDTLKSVLEFMLSNGNKDMHCHDISEQYLAYDIFTRNPNEVVVDCGAFKGEVLAYFAKANAGVFQKYVAVEPDTCYEPYLRKQQEQWGEESVQLVFLALSDQREMLRIRNYNQDDSVILADGEKMIEAITLDELMWQQNVTFLKIDVEGYEEKLLKGAEQIISKQHPIVAIAAYHRELDMIALYKKLKQYDAGYCFFLRSYMNFQECILYAVPKARLQEGKR